jgi:hypothetical protein
MKKAFALFALITFLLGFGQTNVEAQIAPLSGRVSMLQGWPTMLINDKPETPILYTLTDTPSGRWTWEELPQHNIQQFCAQGVRLFQVDMFLDFIWKSENVFDLTIPRKQIKGITDVCPNAAVFFRFHVTAPKWWAAAHPEEWVRYANVEVVPEQLYGIPRILEEDLYPRPRVSLASELWKNVSARQLRRFLTEFGRTQEGKSLVGIHVADGLYGEWHNWSFLYNEPDTSRAMTTYFRGWLQKKYKTNAQLQAAWQNPSAQFATVHVPNMEERRTTQGVFRNPATEQFVIDYYDAVHFMVADRIAFYAQTAKQTWKRPLITGTFYGYFFSVFGREAAGGHLALEHLLKSPYIDYLSGPQAYEPQAIDAGDPYRSRSLTVSVRLHGKLWLDEMDVEPTAANFVAPNYQTQLQENRATTVRNMVFSHTKGMGLWFYDFGVAGIHLGKKPLFERGSQGYWDEPNTLMAIQKVKQILNTKRQSPYTSEADVLFVFDTDVYRYTSSLKKTDPVSNTLVNWQTLAAYKSGIIFDSVHLADLEKVDLSGYKVVVFGNTFLMNDGQRVYIQQKVAQNGRHLIWYYAPAYTDGSSLSEDLMQQVTGFAFHKTNLKQTPEIKFNDVVYKVGTAPFEPVFSVQAPNMTTLGTYTETGEAAIARKQDAHSTSWYIGLPSQNVDPLRTIFNEIGVSRSDKMGDIVYGGGGIVVLHTKLGGKRVISLKNGKKVPLDLAEGLVHTIVLDSETGAILWQ